MNKEAIELVKQYIHATVSGGNMISKDAYELLTHMLQADRSLATELYDIYDQIELCGLRYAIPLEYDEIGDGSEEDLDDEYKS
jgi:hypothetical protein